MIKLNGCDLAERLDTIEIDSNIFLNRLFRHGINRFFSQTLKRLELYLQKQPL